LRILSSICLLLVVAACESKNVTRFEEHPPRPAGSLVEVWMGMSAPGDLANAVPDHRLGRPPKGVKIIGEIDIRKSATWGWSEVVRDAQREARNMGGDGIIIEHSRGSLVTAPKVRILVFRLPEETEKTRTE